MKKMSTKKSLSLAALLSLGLAFGAAHTTLAQSETSTPAEHSAQTMPMNAQTMPMNGPRMMQLDPAMQKAHEKFLAETSGLRKQQMEKHAQMRAIMQSSQPDDAKAARIAGEMFDIQEQIRAKAVANGLPTGMMGSGFGGGRGMMGMMGAGGMGGDMPCGGGQGGNSGKGNRGGHHW